MCLPVLSFFCYHSTIFSPQAIILTLVGFVIAFGCLNFGKEGYLLVAQALINIFVSLPLGTRIRFLLLGFLPWCTFAWCGENSCAIFAFLFLLNFCCVFLDPGDKPGKLEETRLGYGLVALAGGSSRLFKPLCLIFIVRLFYVFFLMNFARTLFSAFVCLHPFRSGDYSAFCATLSSTLL